jgi:hypothetical protein
MDAAPDILITITDVTLAGHCPSGARRWFDDHGLNFRNFLKNGIPAADLLATGDALADQVVSRRLQRDAAAIDTDGVVITIDDVHASLKCSAGARKWATRHGRDYGAFLETGVPAAVLIASGERQAIQIVLDKVRRG